MADQIRIDARGDQCPIPVVKAKKAMDTAGSGDIIEVLADNEIAVQNLTKLARSQNCVSISEKRGEKEFAVTITVAGNRISSSAAAQLPDSEVCIPDRRTGDIVAVGSHVMGSGDEALGKILIKGFIYALSQTDRLPAKILFYNSGIFLTTEGSETIEDLKAMEAQGVEILSCGTCLDFYNRKDRLQVGEIGNMYDIVQAMTNAAKIICP